jgi:hypothetical protein
VLLGRDHAVWRVTAVTDQALTDQDRDVWLAAGMPDLATWPGRPYRVDVDHVGGAVPAGITGGACMDVPARRSTPEGWHTYRGERWPMCSCCGEPMPCRAELQDQEIDRSLRRIDKLMARRPGCCWGCAEPITARQKVVTYPGDNLDLPGGPAVVFHTRQDCYRFAAQYELRWLATDPRHQRILTWPACAGILVVHHDGSSECRGGTGLFGVARDGQPGCGGHLTHDHDMMMACCVVGGTWFGEPDAWAGCPRGCLPAGHPGTRTTPRPARATQDALFPTGATDPARRPR